MESDFTKKDIKLSFLCLLAFLLNISNSFANDKESKRRTNPTWNPYTNVSYDFCSGNVTINMHYADYAGYDDYVTNYQLFYTDINGNDVQFFKWADSSVGGHTISTSNSSSGDLRFKAITWGSAPLNLIGQSLKIKAKVWWTEGYAFEDEHYSRTDNFTITNYSKPGQPTNIAIESDECNRVTISWSHPTISCTTTKFVRIYRNGVHITDQATPTTSYSDTGLQPGQSYTYTLRAGYYYTRSSNRGPILSDYTVGQDGTPKGLPTTPSGVEATINRCDKKIKVNWQWFEQSPSHFKLERSTNINSGYTQIGGSISGSKRNYTDESISYNTNYYYKISAYDSDCSVYGAVSDIVTGYAPDEPAAPSNVAVTKVISGGQPSAKITWTDNSVNETKFKIKRVFASGGSERVFEVDSGVTTFTDTEVENCQPYIYEVYAINICSVDGVISTNKPEFQLDEDIEDTFDGINRKLKVSKGYYSNRVELSWTNNNANLIDQFNIYRRILGESDAPTLIATQNSSASLYSDNTTDAGVLYEYFIIAEGSCGNNTIFSDSTYTTAESAIGFRSPSGIINGSIAYTGGIAVEGAKVLVERAGGNTGKSLSFNGSNQYVMVPHDTTLNPTNAITLSAWVKPDTLLNDMTIISKKSTNSGYRLYYKKSTNKIVFAISTNNTFTEVTADTTLSIGQYNNITATYDGTTAKVYLDGVEKGSASLSGNITTSTNPLYFGGVDGNGSWDGLIDEILIFNTAKDSAAIARDYSRFLNDNEQGLIGYWRIEAGTGSPYIFDASRTGSAYNAHDGSINGAVWSNDIPTGSQLGLVGITSSSGAYTISNIRFNGVGENFTLTPFFGVHSFNPANKVLFIGDGASVHNGQDFEDISSFIVTGSVKYENTSIFVKDAFLKIDGELIIKAGTAVKTDENGQFEIRVPIGEHVITVEKGSHTFTTGRFPSSGEHDFQDALSGIEFIDNTKRKIIGRIVGGTIEGDKKPGLGLSRNNIGVATFNFKHQAGLTLNLAEGRNYEPIETDSLTGEFSIELPPVTYLIDSLKVPSNLTIDFGAQETVDISMEMPIRTEVDTASNGTIDSVKYHLRRDFIHREPLNFEVTNNENTAAFTGESTYTYNNPISGDSTVVSLTGDPFGFPIFSQNKNYNLRISVFEKYTNADSSAANPVEDKVPVQDARITIHNALASVGNAGNEEIINLTTGDTLYTFKTGNPNNAVDVTDANLSYTKTFQLLVEAGGHSKSWSEVRGGSVFRGFVIGQKALGNSFTTQGPEIVNHILRDPPGSRSYAFIETESSTTNTTTYETNISEALNMEKRIYAGAKFTVGIGVSTATDIKNNINLGLEIASSQNERGEHVEVTTYSERFETNKNPISVGAQSDLFVGRSMNMEYGLTNVISLVPDSVSGTVNTDVYGNSGNSTQFRLVKKTGFFVVPGGYETMFIYTQTHIIEQVIPALKNLRNALLDGTHASYTVNFTDTSNPRFGTNNDNTIWGTDSVSTSTPIRTEQLDRTGHSYTFNGAVDTYSIATDSVRWYNQQIRLWEETLAKNEKQKVDAIASGQASRNISYAGGATFSYTHSSQVIDTETSEWEIGFSEAAVLEIEGKVSNVGVGVEHSLALKQKTGKSSSTTTSNSNTYGYVLDDDEEESFSIDIFNPSDGNGPIFYTRAGESSCPYEKEIKTQYHLPGTTISKATLQREIPELSATPIRLVNIPADQEAVYTLSLTNNSASGDDMYYELRILGSSNPHGAIILVDGIDPHQTFLVPAGSSINKTLTIKKGPVEIDYDSIQVILHSPCQYDPTNVDDNIESSIYLTAHFLPTCSPVDISSPEKNWVVNNSYENTLPIVVSDYDINYATLKNVQLQYKASASSDWIILGTWWKDKALAPDPSQADSIPQNVPYISYDWDLSVLADGPYDIRSVAVCTQANITSEVYSGLIDRVNPTLFGSASPADGILAPNDDISVQFNELIDETVLTADNFDVRGVLNGSEIRHNASIFFDGTGDHVSIDNLNLKRKSFTIEFWAKRLANGVEQTIFSQGNIQNRSVQIGFTSADKMSFRLQDEVLTTSDSYTDGRWHHWAIIYDIENENAQIYFDGSSVAVNNSFVTLYDTDGKVYIGKRTFSPESSFTGNLHGFRIWNRARSQSKIVSNFNKKLAGKEGGLIANWRMDEGRGTLTEDIAKARHATVNAQWKLDPQGSGMSFDGTDDYLEVGNPLALTNEHDLTFEFWFKSANGNNITFLSNGKGDGTDSNSNGWRIGTNTSGHIIVNNNGESFTASTGNHFDDSWHHFAVVINRIGNTLAFVDGELKGSISSDEWNGFGASKMWLGTRGWFEGVDEHRDQYFSGVMDEVRIWQLARTQDQIKADMNNKLSGDEIGIGVYFPFEHYTLDAGIYLSTETLANEKEEATDTLVSMGGAIYSAVTPNIKLPRPYQKVNFIYTTNLDKIIITPTDAPSKIENVILDITVKNVKDLNNNILQSPITWTAYVDRNQVSWEDQELEFSKELNDPLEFQSKIVNTGGNIVDFEIDNLPEWLSASPNSGEISPNSTRNITFTINENVNIGNYEESIMLSTAFGFDERLELNLTVSKTPPSNWTVVASDFQYSMSIIGQLSIGGVISTDENDILAAFVNDEIRGLGKVKYVEGLDRYMVFLSIYSNQTSGEALEFKIWNANEGLIHTQVTPDQTIDSFQPDSNFGDPLAPITFSAVNTVLKQVSLPEGWKWLSFNLSSSDLSNVNEILKNLDASNGDEIKDMMYFDKYDTQNGWIGTISSNGGFQNDKLYKLKLANGGTLEYEGEVANPLSHTIDLVPGWNWIPFVSQRNMEIGEALANLNPTQGDLIKGQLQFAVYNSTLGWIGDLESLNPSEGYMIKVQNAASFKFPKSGLYNGRTKNFDEDLIKVGKHEWQLSPYEYKGNMSIIASIDAHKNVFEVDDYLGAFVNGEIRGLAKAVYNSQNKNHLYFLIIYSNNITENITFKLLNKNESNEYSIKEIGAFQNNAVLGTLGNPVPLSLSNIEDYKQGFVEEDKIMNTYPNPFSNSLKIDINLKHNVHMLVEVYNVTGQRVGIIANESYSAGIHQLEWAPNDFNGNVLPKGVYKIKITTPLFSESKSVFYR